MRTPALPSCQILFFDKNPIGRVLNRFTRDMEYIDMQIVQNISQFVNTFGGPTTTPAREKKDTEQQQDGDWDADGEEDI
ncbi:unnamed protein product [Prorocentrum cordatum]|uniref:Uncharacterized protein n=1 Tax=Prorocentrum cordatum TaxID=2364126 RepID=A0ABN9T7L2_9DINO|nr:unnamed protein product [Polarella glacialis]